MAVVGIDLGTLHSKVRFFTMSTDAYADGKILV